MMRALPCLAVAIIAASAAPARALPLAGAVAISAPTLRLVTPVKHHSRHTHWRYYGYQRWSRYGPYYTLPPEAQAVEDRSAYPPSINAGQPSAAAPLQRPPDSGAGSALATRPKIEWVNPDHPVR
ncbi:MAG TPA: hypothetical protein VHO95_05530 [Candidatus Dormibacteraeota bacterium]|nr:hypothetical protein [Candidatus Dormibacteraeota bacterium]